MATANQQVAESLKQSCGFVQVDIPEGTEAMLTPYQQNAIFNMRLLGGYVELFFGVRVVFVTFRTMGVDIAGDPSLNLVCRYRVGAKGKATRM